MTTKGQEMENFVHEIKNKLAVIKGYTQILIKRTGNTMDEKSLIYLVKIDKKINELTKFLKKGENEQKKS